MIVFNPKELLHYYPYNDNVTPRVMFSIKTLEEEYLCNIIVLENQA